MATAIPSIACLGVIGRNNNPLYISIFPSHDPQTNTLQPIRTPLQFSLLLSSTLDIFDLRTKQPTTTTGGSAAAAPMLSGDYGLLHAVDERLAAYGFETNTGVRFVAVVDMRGRRVDGAALGVMAGEDAGQKEEAAAKMMMAQRRAASTTTAAAAVVGLKESDMKVVFRAMQAAYVRLLQNPFYDPDEHAGGGAGAGGNGGGKRISSKRFERDMRKIGEGWTVGVTSLG